MLQNIRPMQPMQSRQNFGQLRMENTRAAEMAIRVACEMDSRMPRTLQRVEGDQANIHSAHIILDGDHNGSLIIKIKEAATGAIQDVRDYIMKHDRIAALEWDVTDESDKLSTVSRHVLNYDRASHVNAAVDSDFDF